MIKKIEFKNFGSFDEFEVEFKGKVTRLIGSNGVGKTTIGLTGLWAGLKGISENQKNGTMIGERFRFIKGDNKSADIYITIFDSNLNAEVIVRNHITKQSNSITFTRKDGKDLPDGWLKNLFNASFISAKEFCNLDSKRQAVELGIDVSSFNEELKSLKEKYTEINREVTKLKAIIPETPKEKVEPISLTEKLNELNKILAENEKLSKARTERAKQQEEITKKYNSVLEKKTEIEQLEIKLAKLKAEFEVEKDNYNNEAITFSELEPIADDLETETIKKEIANIEEINEKARTYSAYLENLETLNKVSALLEENKVKQNEVISRKNQYLKDIKLDMEGLEIDDEGNLIYKNRPLKSQYFSKGQLEMIVTELFVRTMPYLKVKFIDDFDLLDEENQKTIIEFLLENDFQVITSEIHRREEEFDGSEIKIIQRF